MRKAFFLLVFSLASNVLFAQNEIGPEGHKLIWVLLAILVVGAVFILTAKANKKKSSTKNQSIFHSRNVVLELTKDALYYPDILTLFVRNKGKSDIDIDRPLLLFDNFWLKRKFKLKGQDNHRFYPLYLEKGKTHTLQIDLNRFYGHDKRLKKFPKVKIVVSDVNGKKLGSRSVFLRKTLLKF